MSDLCVDSVVLTTVSERTNNLFPWIRTLKKLIVTQLFNKYPTYFGTRSFIAVFTKPATGPCLKPI